MEVEKLAEFLINYDGEYDIYCCSDNEEFEDKPEAIQHEITWLESEVD